MKSLAHIPRLVTGKLRQLPDFIIIGAQRAGTSSLFAYLEQHPQITGSSKKEVHYFDTHFHKGETWYRSFFPLSQANGGDHIVGEASPYYIVHPHCPARIHQLLPEVKLIALLRNPSERAISHYFHELSRGCEDLDLQAALDAEEDRIRDEWKRLQSDGAYRSRAHQSFSYKQRGLYLEQLKRYHQFFSRERLLVLDSGELFRNPEATFTRILEFLGVDSPCDQISFSPKNAGKYSAEVSASLVEDLDAYFAPHNQALFTYLGQSFDW